MEKILTKEEVIESWSLILKEEKVDFAKVLLLLDNETKPLYFFVDGKDGYYRPALEYPHRKPGFAFIHHLQKKDDSPKNIVINNTSDYTEKESNVNFTDYGITELNLVKDLDIEDFLFDVYEGL